MKQTLIGEPKRVFEQPWLNLVDKAPVIGARPVWWHIGDDQWKHVGWLMPEHYYYAGGQ